MLSTEKNAHWEFLFLPLFFFVKFEPQILRHLDFFIIGALKIMTEFISLGHKVDNYVSQLFLEIRFVTILSRPLIYIKKKFEWFGLRGSKATRKV